MIILLLVVVLFALWLIVRRVRYASYVARVEAHNAAIIAADRKIAEEERKIAALADSIAYDNERNPADHFNPVWND